MRATAPAGYCPVRAGLGRNRPLPCRGGLGRDLVVGGKPCMGVGQGWPTLLLAAFAVKRQQERVERFYREGGE
ncbi:hypothetical protein B296_00037487 [Ensete ventricosum]|uniref:Uncharacterized protein n=1 Tax=Ensete ventricosum TaxID=4639 RepID=A0A426WWK6_ENSVE|nr:hypothetical protein B296_00037487 [Ensete ventricosum]